MRFPSDKSFNYFIIVYVLQKQKRKDILRENEMKFSGKFNAGTHYVRINLLT